MGREFGAPFPAVVRQNCAACSRKCSRRRFLEKLKWSRFWRNHPNMTILEMVARDRIKLSTRGFSVRKRAPQKWQFSAEKRYLQAFTPIAILLYPSTSCSIEQPLCTGNVPEPIHPVVPRTFDGWNPPRRQLRLAHIVNQPFRTLRDGQDRAGPCRV